MDLVVGERTIGDVGLVVFDKDGTLIELYHYWSQMVALRARLIARALRLDRGREAGLVRALGVDVPAGETQPGGAGGPQAAGSRHPGRRRLPRRGSAVPDPRGPASRPSSARTRFRPRTSGGSSHRPPARGR